MRSFTNFLQKIADALPDRGIPADALLRLDPSRIDVENVRSVLGTTTSAAKRVCETAVRRGLFIRKISVVCPDGAIAWTGIAGATPPPDVRCWREGEFGPEPYRMSTGDLEQKEFYALNGR